MRTVSFTLILLLVLLLAGACNKQPNFQGKDLEMVQAATVIRDAIHNYRSQTLEFPESMDTARSALPAGEDWPANPYNGSAITDTGSPDFDPATSVGNVYYQKFERDGQVTGFQLHVFGEKKKLWVLTMTAFGAKE